MTQVIEKKVIKSAIKSTVKSLRNGVTLQERRKVKILSGDNLVGVIWPPVCNRLDFFQNLVWTSPHVPICSDGPALFE